MDYKTKIKIRMLLGAVYALIGAAFIAGGILFPQGEYSTPFGCAFAAVGIALFIKNMRLLCDRTALKNRQIAEEDERNLMIVSKARNLSSAIYIFVLGIADMVLMFLGRDRAVYIVSLALCVFLIIYIVCYEIIKRTN